MHITDVVVQRLGSLVSGFDSGLGSGVEMGGECFGGRGGRGRGEIIGGGCHVNIAPFLWAGSVVMCTVRV